MAILNTYSTTLSLIASTGETFSDVSSIVVFVTKFLYQSL